MSHHPSFLWLMRHQPLAVCTAFLLPIVYCVVSLVGLNYIDNEYGSLASNLTAGALIIVCLAVLNRGS